MSKRLHKYLRLDTMPTAFCPGCGHGMLMNAILQSIDELQLDFDKIVFVSGIGCSGWIPNPHFKTDVIHVTHGRSIAFASGIKLSKPELKVVVIGGDGDLLSIGTNHLIHAARRNLDIFVICANNYMYAMTGGQISSTTPLFSDENAFDLNMLIPASGGKCVLNGSTENQEELINALNKGFLYKGFSFINVISKCTTYTYRYKDNN